MVLFRFSVPSPCVWFKRFPRPSCFRVFGWSRCAMRHCLDRLVPGHGPGGANEVTPFPRDGCPLFSAFVAAFASTFAPTTSSQCLNALLLLPRFTTSSRRLSSAPHPLLSVVLSACRPASLRIAAVRVVECHSTVATGDGWSRQQIPFSTPMPVYFLHCIVDSLSSSLLLRRFLRLRNSCLPPCCSASFSASLLSRTELATSVLSLYM